MAQPFQEFNIMGLVGDAHRANPLVMASYDTVNRMVSLIGNITFHDLFSTPLGELVPQYLASNARDAADIRPQGRPPLIADIDPIIAHLNELQKSDKLTFLDLLAPKPDTDPAVSDTLYALHKSGIYLPTPPAGQPPDLSVQRAASNLVKYAGDLTYLDVYTKGKTDLEAASADNTIKAVHRAMDNGLLFAMVNNMCCQTTSTGQGCIPTRLSLGCSPASGGLGCAIGSKPCGRPRRT